MWIVFPRARLRVSVFALPAAIIMLTLETALPFAVLVLSALLHEAGHIAALRLCGARPRRVDLLPLGALIVCPEGLSYSQEMLVALSGPVVSALCASACAVVYLASGGIYPLFAFFVNSLLAAFNILPAAKTDGGKALFCALEAANRGGEKARRLCAACNYCALLAFTAAMLFVFFKTGRNAGVALLYFSLLVQII